MLYLLVGSKDLNPEKTQIGMMIPLDEALLKGNRLGAKSVKHFVHMSLEQIYKIDIYNTDTDHLHRIFTSKFKTWMEEDIDG